MARQQDPLDRWATPPTTPPPAAGGGDPLDRWSAPATRTQQPPPSQAQSSTDPLDRWATNPSTTPSPQSSAPARYFAPGVDENEGIAPMFRRFMGMDDPKGKDKDKATAARRAVGMEGPGGSAASQAGVAAVEKALQVVDWAMRGPANLQAGVRKSISALMQGESIGSDPVMEGGRQAVSGAGTMATAAAAPVLGPMAMARPVATAALLGAGKVVGEGVHYVSDKVGKEYAGLTEQQSGLVADVMSEVLDIGTMMRASRLALPDPDGKWWRNWLHALPPGKGGNSYNKDDVKVAVPHIFAQSKGPIATHTQAAEEATKASNHIDDIVDRIAAFYPTDTIPTNPLAAARAKLRDSVKTDEAFYDKGMSWLVNEYKAFARGGPITLTEANKIRNNLNADHYNRLRDNKFDRGRALKTDPEFAAADAALHALRDGLDAGLTRRGIDGLKELRATQGSIIRLRDRIFYDVDNGETVKPGSGLPRVGRAVSSIGSSGMGVVRGRLVRGLGTLTDVLMGGGRTYDQLLADAFAGMGKQADPKLPGVPIGPTPPPGWRPPPGGPGGPGQGPGPGRGPAGGPGRGPGPGGGPGGRGGAGGGPGGGRGAGGGASTSGRAPAWQAMHAYYKRQGMSDAEATKRANADEAVYRARQNQKPDEPAGLIEGFTEGDVTDPSANMAAVREAQVRLGVALSNGQRAMAAALHGRGMSVDDAIRRVGGMNVPYDPSDPPTVGNEGPPRLGRGPLVTPPPPGSTPPVDRPPREQPPSTSAQRPAVITEIGPDGQPRVVYSGDPNHPYGPDAPPDDGAGVQTGSGGPPPLLPMSSLIGQPPQAPAQQGRLPIKWPGTKKPAKPPKGGKGKPADAPGDAPAVRPKMPDGSDMTPEEAEMYDALIATGAKMADGSPMTPEYIIESFVQRRAEAAPDKPKGKKKDHRVDSEGRIVGPGGLDPREPVSDSPPFRYASKRMSHMKRREGERHEAFEQRRLKAYQEADERRIADHYDDVFAHVAVRARDIDPSVDIDNLRDLFDEHMKFYADSVGDVETARGDPIKLLRRIAELGGIGSNKAYYRGERNSIADGLKFGRVHGIPGVFTAKGHDMEFIQGIVSQDPEFAWITGPSELVEALGRIIATGVINESGTLPGTAKLGAAGIDTKTAWWEDSFLGPRRPEPDTETTASSDVLDTGEEQPRLPGDVGDVRDKNNETPELDSEFSLTGETDEGPKGTTSPLFGPPTEESIKANMETLPLSELKEIAQDKGEDAVVRRIAREVASSRDVAWWR